jgi:hypothetical protein
VQKDPAVPEEQADGLKGLMARLARVNYYNTISTCWLILHKEERLGIDVAQTGNRISRNPATFVREVEKLHKLLPRLAKMLKELGGAHCAWETGPSAERMQYCNQAIAMLKLTRKELAR